jgi:hypothetical protein
MPAVEVTGVDVQPDHALVGGWLDAPQPGATSADYALDASGWAIADLDGPCDIEARHGRHVLRREIADGERPDVGRALPDVPGAARSGFAMTVGLLQLPPDFVLDITVAPPSGSPLLLARIRGRRAALPPAPASYLQPIPVTGHGRSGTQWLVRLLGKHPEIVAHRPFELEPRVLVYWLSVLRDLADPASQAEVLARSASDRRYWLGDRARTDAIFHSPAAIRAELGRDSIDELVAFARHRVERFYRAAADLDGVPAPRFFVEKSTPHDYPLLGLQRELYPAASEVLLVRDFRDTFASMRAFNLKRGQRGFGGAPDGSDEEHLIYLRDVGRRILADYRARAEASRLVRYEDLIQEPEQTLGALIAWLGLEPTPAIVAGMIARASEDTPQMRDHRTSPDVAASIGRWRRDLSPELQERSCEILEEVLAGFGYEVGARSSDQGRF